ncbi:HTH domain-containing protein [Haliea sp.]|jgi:hypothetical protein|uniref:HTH domain-containing protein n=1 Tax=Haliea sp. TaxID=1932666 RepID=UPI000C6B14EF|nr:HTH domain-containing protein [Haliea sp.]MAD65710.1 hypothetical protein [Haliea sp.]|tara:strand:+ start:48992 stop:49279 length:288 start_codon:yes stop_codon:yes gene_type:complete
MLKMNPARARMFCVLALKHKDPRIWTRDKLAEEYDVSKVTITQAINSAKSFGVEFSTVSESERAIGITDWGAFSKKWVLDNFKILDEIGKNKRAG